jgi:hypothetical protein
MGLQNLNQLSLFLFLKEFLLFLFKIFVTLAITKFSKKSDYIKKLHTPKS